MSKLFYKKSTAIAVITAILILVLLVCMLLVTLMQMSSLKERAAKLNTLIENARENEAELEELKEFLKTDDFVRKWAEEHGRIKGDDISWLEKNGL